MASWARGAGKEHGNDAESTTLLLLLDVVPMILLGIVRESA